MLPIKQSNFQKIIRQQWTSPEEAIEKYVSFENSFGSLHSLLACHAAFPLFLTPELINLIRINFLDNENIPWIAESDFLLSPLCSSIGEGIYKVDQSAREIMLIDLQNRYSFDSNYVYKLASFLQSYVENTSEIDQNPDIRQTHSFISSAYLDPNKTIEEMTKQLIGTVQEVEFGNSAEVMHRQIQIASTIEVVRDVLNEHIPWSTLKDLTEAADLLAYYWYRDPEFVQNPFEINPLAKNNSLLVNFLGKINRYRQNKVKISTLESKISSLDKKVRLSAVMELGKLSNLSIKPLLRKAIYDKDREVRKQAILNLGNYQDEETISLLSSLLTDEDQDIRGTVLKILGSFNIPNVIPDIFKLVSVNDESGQVASTIITELWLKSIHFRYIIDNLIKQVELNDNGIKLLIRLVGSDVDLNNSIFHIFRQNNSDLSHAVMNNVNLNGIELEGLRLKYASFENTTLEAVNLSGADLTGAKLNDCNLQGANLRKATFRKADLSRSNLSKSDLSYCTLTEALLIKTTLIDTILEYCDLSSAYFQNADLLGADLTGADLRATSFIDTNLFGCNLTYAKFDKDTVIDEKYRTQANSSTTKIKISNSEEISELNERVLKFPENPQLLLARSKAKQRINLYDEAIGDASRAIELKQNSWEAYFTRGLLYKEIKNFVKAKDDFNSARVLDPNNPETYYELGNTYVKMDRYKEAIYEYKKAVTLDFKNSNAHLGLGDAYIYLKDYDLATIQYQQVISLDLEKQPDSIIKYKAVKSLVEIGFATRKIEPLIAILNDQETAVRKIAAEALGKIGDTHAIEPLLAAVNDKEEAVREIVKDALERLKGIKPARQLKNQENETPIVGETRKGTIASIGARQILVSIGTKSEGVITGKEFEAIPIEVLKTMAVGEEIDVYVINPEDKNGDVVLSYIHARDEANWKDAEEKEASGAIFNSEIIGYNKGGLLVMLGGLHGFVPSSQISLTRRAGMTSDNPAQKWSKMVGDTITVRVIEVDRERRRLILSERAASTETRESVKDRILEELKEGEVRTGRVTNLVSFGAFVNINGADGLVHISEISWDRINSPNDVLWIGEEVKVKIISIDREKRRIGLSIRRLQDDPWINQVSHFQVGQLVEGKITKLAKFGAFARLEGDIEGLIHISELSEKRIAHPNEVLIEGDVVTLRVQKIDSENHRIGLSLRRVDSPFYTELDWHYMVDEQKISLEEEKTDNPNTPQELSE